MARAWFATIGLALAIALTPARSEAQDWAFGLEWGATAGTGDLNDYIDRLGWRNFGIEVRKHMAENWSVGVTGGWHVFDQKLSNVTAELPNGAIWGTQNRYVNSIPLLVDGQYYFGERYARNRPFVGLGVGAANVLQRLEIGIVALETSNWHLAVAPEVGYALGTGPLGDTSIVFRGAMYQAFASGENLAGDKVGYTYFLVSIGVSLR